MYFTNREDKPTPEMKIIHTLKLDQSTGLDLEIWTIVLAYMIS